MLENVLEKGVNFLSVHVLIVTRQSSSSQQELVSLSLVANPHDILPSHMSMEGIEKENFRLQFSSPTKDLDDFNVSQMFSTLPVTCTSLRDLARTIVVASQDNVPQGSAGNPNVVDNIPTTNLGHSNDVFNHVQTDHEFGVIFYPIPIWMPHLLPCHTFKVLFKISRLKCQDNMKSFIVAYW